MATRSDGNHPVASNGFARMLWRHRGEPGMLIPLLQAAQDSYGYVPQVAIEQIAAVTSVPPSEIYGVITFYKQFRLRPVGKHLIRLCKGTACHVQGADLIVQTAKDELRVEPDETTDDRLFTPTVVACLGCCSLAPVLMIDDQTHGRMTPQKVRRVLRQYRRRGESPPTEAAQGAVEAEATSTHR